MEQNRKSLIRRASSSFKHNASFVARLPTIRRHKSQSLHSPAGNSKPPTASVRGRGIRTMAAMNASAENLGSANVFIHLLSATLRDRHVVPKYLLILVGGHFSK